MATGATEERQYPLRSRVEIHSLIQASDWNDSVGVVETPLNENGRQVVFVESLQKRVALKPTNLRYEPRSIDSLSAKELKAILLHVVATDADSSFINRINGVVEKAELRAMVVEAIGDESQHSSLKVAKLLAEINAPKQTVPTTTTQNTTPTTTPADVVSQMNPERLRQQAQMMRSMPLASLRQMNPQMFGNLSDNQILQAISQMEHMANNPTAMKMAQDQVRNMSPQELQRMQEMSAAATSVSDTTSAPSVPSNAGSTRSSLASRSATSNAANQMSNMTPEQIRSQAKMMQSLPPDQIRRMSPHLAHMSDEQIRMAATQFETMASNPAMMEMAMEQMRAMSDDDVSRLQQQMINNNNNNHSTTMNATDSSETGVADPSKMLETMDAKQIKGMMAMIKDNPSMLKQLSQMTGMNEETLQSGVDQFGGLSDNQMEAALKVMKKAQTAKEAWVAADKKVGGYLKLIVLSVLAVLFVALVAMGWRFWFATTTPAQSPTTMDALVHGGEPLVTMDEDDEFSEL